MPSPTSKGVSPRLGREIDKALGEDSPVKGMDFPDAMREVILGKKVTRLEWNDPTIFVFLRTKETDADDRLKITRDGKTFDLLVSSGDMDGKDWVVVE